MNQITTPNFLASYGQGLQINQARQEIGNRNALTQALQSGDMGAAQSAYSALDPVGAFQAAQPAPPDRKAMMQQAGQLTRAVLGAPPELRADVYREALDIARGSGMTIDGLPEEYDEQRVIVMDRMFNMPEAQQTEFERQLQMIPEGPERDRAVRIALKLETGATNQQATTYAPDEYERYFAEEQAAGRQPLGRIEFKQAGRGGGITIGANGTVQIGGPGGSYGGSGRDPDRMAKELSVADVDLIKGAREAATAAGDLVSLANQMEPLVSRSPGGGTPRVGYTGPGGEIVGLVDDVVGFLPGTPGARGAFKTLSLEAQLTFTAKTKGAITDREMGMFREAVANMGQRPEANKQIIQVIRAGAQRVQQRAEFYERYLDQNGNMANAQAAWRRYIEENPAFSYDPDNGFTVNTPAPFDQYITKPTAPPPPGVSPEDWEAMDPEDRVTFE